jgi:hypothetical protein
MEEWAVLLMAYGGPDSLEDVEPYLLDVRGGRTTPPDLVEEIRARYERIGGKSPLLEITNAQAKALQERLNQGCFDGRTISSLCRYAALGTHHSRYRSKNIPGWFATRCSALHDSVSLPHERWSVL